MFFFFSLFALDICILHFFNITVCVQTCLKYIVLVINSEGARLYQYFNELQYSYHSSIIVLLYVMFTVQSPLNSLKCHIAGIFSHYTMYSHWFLRGHMTSNNVTVSRQNL